MKELNNLLYILTGLSNNLSSVRSIKIRDPRLYSSDPPKAVTSSLGVRTDKKGISLVAFFVSVRWSLVSKLYTLPASKDIDVSKDDITFLLIRFTENIFKENHKYYIINLALGIFFFLQYFTCTNRYIFSALMTIPQCVQPNPHLKVLFVIFWWKCRNDIISFSDFRK